MIPVRNGRRDLDRGIRSHLDSLFEDWFGRSMQGVLAPRVDVIENETELSVSAELPGVKEEDIDVSLMGDRLVIKGTKRTEHTEEKEVDGRILHRAERSYGSFERSIVIPYVVDPSQVIARFENGVLKVTLPKPADAIGQKQPHKIQVIKPPSEHPQR